MENRGKEILSEIKGLVLDLRQRLEELEAKVAELEANAAESAPIVEVALVEEVAALAAAEEFVEVAEVAEVPDVAELPEVAEVPEVVEAPEIEESADVVEDEQVEQVDAIDLDDFEPEFAEPVIEPSVEKILESALGPSPRPAFEPVADAPVADAPVAAAPVVDVPVADAPVIDAMALRHPWRTDMPGSPVRDVRSAISLNDRILFINELFSEDPVAFQNTIASINLMTSLNEVVSFLVAEHPEWDLDSDTVYRFMMAVRRRVNQ